MASIGTAQKRIFRLLTALLGDRSGSIAMMTGIMATTLVGMAGLSVDVGNWYYTHSAMQSAADAAAIGGMTRLRWGGDNTQVIAAANADAQSNGFTTGNGTVVTVTVAADRHSVTVSISQPAQRFLSSVVLASATTISATATAGVVNGGPACILATNPTADADVGSPGNGKIQAPGCAVVADSTSTSAIAVGSGSITASSICAPGGYTINNSGMASPTPTRCPAIPDPLANLPAPANVNAPCEHTDFRVTAANAPPVAPGVYCGGITVGSNVTATFQPGVYILRNGGLSGQGTAVLNGTGVGFWLTGSGTAVQLSRDDVNLTGNVTVNLSAPTSGPMAGLIFYQSNDAPTGDITHTITGDDKTNFTGTLYFGNQNVVFTGNGTVNGTAAFTAVIANTVTVTGSAILRLGNNFGGTDVPPLLSLSRVALIN
jgi:Flp pilus assembly protein TadG